MPQPLADLRHPVLSHLRRRPERAAGRAVPPQMLGWRWWKRERLDRDLSVDVPAVEAVLERSG